jgi:hypothetical protein
MSNIERLRREIARAQRSGVGPRLRYREALQQAVAVWSRVQMASGRSAREVSRVLGLREKTRMRWVQQRPSRVRPVTVIAPPTAEPATGALCLVTPSGCRIEGLDVTTAAALVRALS